MGRERVPAARDVARAEFAGRSAVWRAGVPWRRCSVPRRKNYRLRKRPTLRGQMHGDGAAENSPERGRIVLRSKKGPHADDTDDRNDNPEPGALIHMARSEPPNRIGLKQPGALAPRDGCVRLRSPTGAPRLGVLPHSGQEKAGQRQKKPTQPLCNPKRRPIESAHPARRDNESPR